LPPDQVEVDYLLRQGVSLLTASNVQALRQLNLAAIQPIVNNQAQQILRGPSFAPRDVNMFSPQLYRGVETGPAAPHPINELQLRGEALVTLIKRFKGNLIAVAQGTAIYDDPRVKRVVADPRLRAALAMLKGTVGEGAIDGIKSGVYSVVYFGTPPANGPNSSPQDTAGQVVPDPDRPGKLQIIFDTRYQYEDAKLLAGVLSHEALHEDVADSNKEELTNTAIDTAVYAQLINEDPGLARSGTELSRRFNTALMALINSRDAQGNIRLLSSNTSNVYPGSLAPPLPYFAFGFVSQGLGADTPGNLTLDEDLSEIAGMEVSEANFDQNTLNLLDSDINNVFTPSEWVRLALILKLDVTD
jgi:hypothetical protein